MRPMLALVLLASPLVAPLPAQSRVPSEASVVTPSTLPALARAVDSMRAGRNDRALGLALQALAEAQEEAGAPPQAMDTWRETIRVAAEIRDSALLAQAHNALGLLHWRGNRYDSALVHLSRSRTLRVATGDSVGLGLVLNSIGSTHYQSGQYEPALAAFTKALEIRRALHDAPAVALVLTNIGLTYSDFGQRDRARVVLEQAVAVAQSAGAPLAAGYALNTLGMLSLRSGQYAWAEQQFARSLEAYSAPGLSAADSMRGWSLNALSLGLLRVREGRAAEAFPHLDSVLVIAQSTGSLRGQARVLLYLGEAHRALGQTAQAASALTQSLDVAQRVNQRVLALDAMAQLADLEEAAGNTRSALAYLRRHQALRDTVFDQATAQRIAAMDAEAVNARQQRENALLREEQRLQSLVIGRQELTVTLGTIILVLAAGVVALLGYVNRTGRVRAAQLARSNDDLETANRDLRTALSEVRTLKGLIPICASCKKVRDDEGFWGAVETYIASRSDAQFSHSICASCGPTLYGEHWPNDLPDESPDELPDELPDAEDALPRT